jgi:hypothetical protein
MSVQQLLNFTKAPAPGFRCNVGPKQTDRSFVAKVLHNLCPPATLANIDRIRQVLGDHADQVIAFHSLHDGFVLYQDTLSDAAGVELFPVERWGEATEDMRNCFEHLANDPENDPDCILTGIAIATVPQSGNYFVFPLDTRFPEILTMRGYGSSQAGLAVEERKMAPSGMD